MDSTNTEVVTHMIDRDKFTVCWVMLAGEETTLKAKDVTCPNCLAAMHERR